LWPGPIASFTMLKLAYLSAAVFFRRSRKTYAATSTGTISRSQSISGHRNVIASSQVLGQISSRRQLASPLAQVGEPQNCIDKVIAGGQFQGVHASPAERRPELLLAALGRHRKTLPESPIVGVDE